MYVESMPSFLSTPTALLHDLLPSSRPCRCLSDVYAALRKILFTDSSIAGEAAALAMGLVAMGSASESAVSELLSYGETHTRSSAQIAGNVVVGVCEGVRTNGRINKYQSCQSSCSWKRGFLPVF